MTGDTWAAERYGLQHVDVKPGCGLGEKPGRLYSGLNSGHQAIQWAYHKGAARIILIGYDMQHTGGRRHWHEDHPGGMSNAEGIAGWVKGFTSLARELALRGVQVVNCSEETALQCFERGQLRDYL